MSRMTKLKDQLTLLKIQKIAPVTSDNIVVGARTTTPISQTLSTKDRSPLLQRTLRQKLRPLHHRTLQKNLDSFETLLQSPGSPDMLLFNRILGRIAQLRLYSLAISMERRMESLGVTPDTCTLSIVINCFCKLNLTRFASSVFGNFFKLGLKIDKITKITLLSGFIVNDDPIGATEFFDKIPADDDDEKCLFMSITFNRLLSALCKDGKTREALRLLRETHNRGGFRLDRISYNTVIDGLCRKGLISDAVGVLSMMKGRMKSPDIFTYNTLIHGSCLLGDFERAMRFVGEMKRRRIYPDVHTYSTLIDGHCKKGSIEDAKGLLKTMAIERILPNVVTFNSLIHAYCKAGDLERARDVFQRIAFGGLRPNVKTYTIMIDGLLKKGLLEEALKLFRDMEEKGCRPNETTYNIMIRGYVLNREISRATQLTREMLDKGFAEDDATRRIFSDLVSDGKLDSSLQPIPGENKFVVYETHLIE